MSLVEKRMYCSELLQFESDPMTGWELESHSLSRSGCIERYLKNQELTEEWMVSCLPKICFSFSTLISYQ